MLPALGAEDYGKGLALGVDLIAQTFAAEFGVTLTSPEYAMPPPADDRKQVAIPAGWLIAILILLLIVSRGRLLWIPFWILSQGRGGGWSGGRGGGGFGGGGFGGFGGGGGFSGGGAGGRF